MNSETQIKPFMGHKDIWSDDLVSCEDTDECSSQVPKMTYQFSNTLKDNKGKSNKEDFCCLPMTPKDGDNGEAQESNSEQAAFREDLSLSKPCSLRCKKPKAKTFTLNSQKRYLSIKEVKLLRKVSSSEILQVLLN
ncbi:unnamed protein product [Moneuplotes crassus]|uniref:Uncharacterized protein n=1 Tax=Euplotes crassus TaxID=5936 RepID=A0AAD2DAW4_EUPCR|nr:unnamed protein product [Moneuplotes crassus]